MKIALWQRHLKTFSRDMVSVIQAPLIHEYRHKRGAADVTIRKLSTRSAAELGSASAKRRFGLLASDFECRKKRKGCFYGRFAFFRFFQHLFFRVADKEK
jgi:hypothetical protein